MDPERWHQLKSIFGGALERDPSSRSVYLDRACAGDDALRAEVEALLSHHDEDFLETPATELSADLNAGSSAGDLAGRTLGPYSILRKIGEGGMGVVYLAEDTRLGRQVAIKALASRYTQDERHRERLKREARIAATLAHPAIATVFALEEFEGSFYIVGEYVRGKTLLEEMASGLLPDTRLLDVSTEVARALAAAHEQGIIHRDLKPENVMLTPDGAVKILDFGLARSQTGDHRDVSPAARLTGAGTFLGTPAYASPEQLLGLDMDFRTDIFSFGVILYEMAAGAHPFAAADSVATIARILESEPDDLTALRPMTTPGLALIVRRCLRKTPGQRYGATRELVTDLEHLRHAARAVGPRQQAFPLPSAPPAPAPRLHPLWWWQFHQAWVGFMYYLMLYPMWKVKVWTTGDWGSLFFFLSVAAVAVASNLRIHLWFTSVFYRSELRQQRNSVSRWIRCADVLFVTLLAIGGTTIHAAHAAMATLLIAVAIGSLGAFLLIEPTTTRAAFEAPRE